MHRFPVTGSWDAATDHPLVEAQNRVPDRRAFHRVGELVDHQASPGHLQVPIHVVADANEIAS